MKKKHILLGSLVIIYLISRLIFLTSVPIFNDESTYLRVAANQIKEPDHKPYSLNIGKEPLMPYLFGISGEVTGNYLVGGRLVSVFFGLLTLIGLFYFTKEVFSKKAAIIVSVIYIFSPFNLFYDRLALLDGAISTISIWSLYLTYLLFKFKKWSHAIFLGIVMGLGIWIKATSLFFVFLPIISYPLFYLFDKSKKDDKNFTVILLGLSVSVAIISYFILYSNSFYAEYLILIKQYTYPISHIFKFPINIWLDNLSNITQWHLFYLIPIIPILAIFYVITRRKEYKKFYLIILWFLLPLAYEIIFGKLLTARHSLLLSIPLIILASAYLSEIKNKYIFYVIFVTYIIIALFYNSILYINPQKLPNLYVLDAKVDLIPYFYGFSSGYGVSEAIEYLRDASKKENITVIVRNDHGNPEDAIIGHFYYDKKIKIITANDVDHEYVLGEIENYLSSIGSNETVYFVSRGNYYMGVDKFFKDEIRFEKPNDTEFIGVYKLGL